MVQFQFQDIIQNVKSPSAIDESVPEFSHCQLLEVRARWLGFQSFNHMRETLRHLPADNLSRVSLGLMRRLCANKLPSQDCAYYEFIRLPKGVGYYSYWIGWDKHGDEVRVPRPLVGLDSVRAVRKASGVPVYVVENDRELTAWQNVWRSTAYIPKDLAVRRFPLQFEKRHLVEPDPPMNLVKMRANLYLNNIVGVDTE